MIKALINKEFRAYLHSPLGWILFAYITLMQGLCLSTAMKALSDMPMIQNLVYVTYHTPNFWFFLLFLFPLLTMRLFSAEESSGTLECLLTTPVETHHLVIAKFTSAFLFYSILWLPGIAIFLSFGIITDLPMPLIREVIFSTHLFLLYLGAYFISLGCLASSMTRNQIIASVITIGFLVTQYFLGYVTIIWGGQFIAAPLFDLFSAQKHLSLACQGVIDFTPLTLFSLLTLFMLLLTYHMVNYRRWKH